MKKAEYLLLMIAVVLLLSLSVPHYRYSSPPEKFVNREVWTYQKPAKWAAYVECTAGTTSYYQHVVNWTLEYPHDYGLSREGTFKTTILVKNWSRFLAGMPITCDVLGRNEILHNNSLQLAVERLKNMTRGTTDYEKLKPLFLFAGSPKEPLNLTLVHVTVVTNAMKEPVKLPFLITWLGVISASLMGAAFCRKRKTMLIVFLAVVLIGSLFLWNYVETREKTSRASGAFNELLSLNATNQSCIEVGGVQGRFYSHSDVEWFLKTIRRNNATVSSVRWEDTVLRIHVKVNRNNYMRIIGAFKERGWETSVINPEYLTALLNETNDTQEINETLTTLEKYLPYLTPDERKAVEDYMDDLKETLHQDRDQKNLCIAVFATSPEAIIPDYGGYSDFLAKFALVAVFVGLALGRRRDDGTR